MNGGTIKWCFTGKKKVLKRFGFCFRKILKASSWTIKTAQTPKFKWGRILVTAQILDVFNVIFINENSIPSACQNLYESETVTFFECFCFLILCRLPPCTGRQVSQEGKLDRKCMRAHLVKGIWEGKTKKEGKKKERKRKRVEREARGYSFWLLTTPCFAMSLPSLDSHKEMCQPWAFT